MQKLFNLLEINFKKIGFIFSLFAGALFVLPSYAASSDDFDKGLDAYEKGQYVQALEKWLPLAESGDVSAQFNIGIMYEYGQGVRKNSSTAFQWYKQAGDKGDIEAQMRVASMYENGLGVPKNPKVAVSWYQRAADGGDLDAQLKIRMLKLQESRKSK